MLCHGARQQCAFLELEKCFLLHSHEHLVAVDIYLKEQPANTDCSSRSQTAHEPKTFDMKPADEIECFSQQSK